MYLMNNGKLDRGNENPTPVFVLITEENHEKPQPDWSEPGPLGYEYHCNTSFDSKFFMQWRGKYKLEKSIESEFFYCTGILQNHLHGTHSK